MSAQVKSVGIVLLVASLLGLAWLRYADFLHQGRSAPVSSKILNQLEVDGVPNFVLQDVIRRKDVQLADFKNKIIILNFWASWCDPCVDEFPSLIKLIDKFEGKIVLLAVSADYEEADILTFLKAFKVQSPDIHVMWDKDYGVAKQYGTVKLPESYIIGPDGKLIRKISGVDDWATPEAFDFFAHLIDTQASEPKTLSEGQ